jgi:hypothetical protein
MDGLRLKHCLLNLRTRYISFKIVANDRHLTHLFWCEIEQLKIYRRFHEVLELDCTYKTNRYQLPLLNIVGQSCTGHSFFVAHAFLRQEQQFDFRWAMQCLRDVLCMDVDKWVTLSLPALFPPKTLPTEAEMSTLPPLPPSPMSALVESTEKQPILTITLSDVEGVDGDVISESNINKQVNKPVTTATTSTQPPSTQPPSTQPPSTQPPSTTVYPLPIVIITDCDDGLMNAISEVFPNTNNFLCRWHIGKNIASQQKSMPSLQWKILITFLYTLFSSATISKFNTRWANFSDNILTGEVWDEVKRKATYIEEDKKAYTNSLPPNWEQLVRQHLEALSIEIEKNRYISILSTELHRRIFDYVDKTWYKHKEK